MVERGAQTLENQLRRQVERTADIERRLRVLEIEPAALIEQVVAENRVDWFIDLVLDAGATGDGIVDDSGAVAAAIDLADATGKAILVRPGYTFLVDNVIVDTPTVFQGFGKGTSVFKRGSATNPAFNIQTGSVEWHGVEFDNALLTGNCLLVSNGTSGMVWQICAFTNPSATTGHFLSFAADKGGQCLFSGCDLSTPGGDYAILLPNDTADQDRRFIGNAMASVKSFDFGDSLATLVQGNVLGPMTFTGSTGRGVRMVGNYIGSTASFLVKGDRNIIMQNFFPGTTVTLDTTCTNSIYKNNLQTGVVNNGAGNIVGENI